MYKHKDRIDLYNENGEISAEDIPIGAISQFHNRAIKKIVSTFKRTAIVNLSKIEAALGTGRLGSEMMIGDECQIPGSEMHLDIVQNAEEIARSVEDMVKVKPDDDTEVQLSEGDEIMLVQIPSLRSEMVSESSSAVLIAATATAHAIADIFNITPFDGSERLKSAIFGRYPQSKKIKGAITGLLPAWPPLMDGVGLSFRSNRINDIVSITNKNTLNGVALSSILEHAAMFESGDALHPVYERYHLLGLAYQGLNANNLVYDLVKDNGEDGTILGIIEDLVKRATEKGAIGVKETLPSGYNMYKTDDACLWNAYMAAGQLAATIINCGAMRAAQAVPASIVAFNDLIKLNVGLPDLDFGRALGTSIGISFYTHSIYGGAGPGAFSPSNSLLRHCRGFIAPCMVAAMCLDAGTQLFSPDMTSTDYITIRDMLPEELKEPIKHVTSAAIDFEEGVR
ncbi:MAG: methyl-coenzyme M reductase subunit beta [Halobacteriota archaeon]|nr:methyl-coenzyme M reductase subunit beta [Halobacteriota archaeon]